MSNFYAIKPEWNPEDDVVEFKYVDIDEKTFCAYICFVYLHE